MQDVDIASLVSFAELPIPIGVCEIDGTIVGMNLAGEGLLGRSNADVVGKKAWDIAPGAEYIWDDVVAMARRHGTYRGEISIATPLEPRRVQYLVSLREQHGRTFAICFCVDLPDVNAPPAGDPASQHRLEALGLVAGGIAHDFNNQLVSVLAEASVARESPELGEATREALRRIEAAAHRMAQLTRQLLAYAGRGRFVTEVIDPDDLVRHAQEALHRAVRPDADLQVQLNEASVAVEADSALLRQVVQNLVANASEALGDTGGTITIVSKVHDQRWVLEIADTGAGMDARTTARIFDPFFTTKRDRHGLGLSAVHGIMRRLGGEIAVDTKLGRGTLFTIKLPLVAGIEPERKRPSTRLPPPATLKNIRVLVADDEPGVLATVKRLLERRGAVVIVAADGAQAKARLAQGEYQIVLFDVMMPELTGYQLLPLARELQPAARVMLMSGYTEHSRGSDGHEPDAFLEKPFTAKALDQAIDDVLADR